MGAIDLGEPHSYLCSGRAVVDLHLARSHLLVASDRPRRDHPELSDRLATLEIDVDRRTERREDRGDRRSRIVTGQAHDRADGRLEVREPGLVALCLATLRHVGLQRQEIRAFVGFDREHSPVHDERLTGLPVVDRLTIESLAIRETTSQLAEQAPVGERSLENARALSQDLVGAVFGQIRERTVDEEDARSRWFDQVVGDRDRLASQQHPARDHVIELSLAQVGVGVHGWSAEGR